MEKSKYYIVVYAESAFELEDKVNGCIKAGFEPHGSVAVVALGCYLRFTQPCVYKEKTFHGTLTS